MTLQDYFVEHAQLEKEWNYVRNEEDPREMTVRSRKKVWWRCGKGHEWQAALDSRVCAGRGCPYCSNQAVNPGENDIATLAPVMVKLWHPAQNGGLEPTDITPGSNKRLWWRCEKGHEWKARAYTIKAGSGCPYCFGRYAIAGETDLSATHPHFLKMWSPKNQVSPTEVTAGSHKKVWWKCERGHEWEALVGSVVMEGCGCPYCSGKKAIPGETDLATLRPDLMEQWDFGRNTLDPAEVTVASHDKAWWKCELGHSWQAMVFSRTREQGSGCPYCTGRKVLPGFNDLATLKPKLAEEWYQTLNGELKPEDVTLGSNRKVWWKCSDGHVWRAYIYARTKRNGTGCPVCGGKVKQRKSGMEAGAIPKKAKPRSVKEKSPASINA